MIKTVIFDLDNTLYDESDYILQGFRETAKKIGKDFCLEKSAWEATFARLKDFYDKGERNLIFNRVLRHQFPLLPAEEINRYVERELLFYYKLARRRLKLYPDVIPLFRYLQENGKKIGLVTQGNPVNQIYKLSLLNIVECFDAIEISGFYPARRSKPSPFLFRRILVRLNTKPSQAIYVGDNLRTDVGAVKAGIFFCCLNNGKSMKFKSPLVKRIYSLKDIRKLI